MKKFIKVTILLVLLTLMLVSSCLVGFAKEKVITFARPEELRGLDPGNYTSGTNVMLNYLIYDRLVEWNPEAGTGVSIVPSLATEWKISPDGKEYTFKLREGVKFHNGEPFNAECVKVTLERFLKDKTLYDAKRFVDLKEVEVVDDYTVILRFNETTNIGLNALVQTSILPAKAFKEKGLALFDNPIGTGAFTWGYWKHDQETVFYKNPDYWGEPAYMDKFVFLPITEMSTRLAGVLTGEIDICDNMNPDQVPLAESSDNVKANRMLAWGQLFLTLKTSKPPFTDIKFRQAIALGIDKEGIVKQVMKGGRVATGALPQGIFGFDDSLVPVKQDIEKAKQLVKESVYDGRTIELMVTFGMFPNEKELAQVIEGNLEEIGINCKSTIIEYATFMERRAAGDYDIFLGQDSYYGGDLTQNSTRLIAQDVHKMGYVNPELKKLILEQNTTIDVQKRIELLRKIENLINTDFSPLIFIMQFEAIFLQQKGIQGVRYFGDRNSDFRYAHYEGW